jgi:hypothetical protein
MSAQDELAGLDLDAGERRPAAVDAQRLALRAASPLRGKAPAQSVDGLGLFDRDRSPGLF